MFQSFQKPACEEEFTSLFENYKERVLNYTLAICHSRYMAEEITQEIFLKLWLNRDSLHQIINPVSYLFAMARNKTLNHIRKAHSDARLMNEIKSRMWRSSNNVDEQVAFSESDKLLQEAITLLSPQRRLVYRLSRNEGLDHRQIARQMRLSRNTVKNHLVQALRFIRIYMDNNGVFIFILFLLAS